MRAFVVFRLPTGELRELENGDIIGRLWTAGLQLDDPRVSEAHALISLRGGDLTLLSLRRLVAVSGKPVSEVALTPGLRVALAEGLELEVEAVSLPEVVLWLDGPGLAPRALPGVCSLRVEPRVELVGGHVAGAAAWLWSTGLDWRLRVGAEADRPLRPDQPFEVRGRTFRARLRPLADTDGATRQEGGVRQPLRLVARYDSFHVHRAGQPVHVVSGTPGRILSELATLGGLVDWQVIASQIWPDEGDEWLLRRKWDVNLSRVRQKLRDGHVRADLMRSDGLGHLELVLYPGDEVVDET